MMPYLHMVSMRHVGERYEAPYEVLKHVKSSVNGRLGTIQPGAQDKRGQINLTWLPKQSVKSHHYHWKGVLQLGRR